MSDTKKDPAAKPNPTQFFVEMEHKWLKHWYDTGIVDKYLHKNDDKKDVYSYMDGPITANNPMGVHHAWGRTYKDLWQRFHNLLGRRQRFQNGFDCQGLWVEVEVEKELALGSKKDIENLVPGDKKASIAKFVQLCKDRVIKFSDIQTEQSKRLGYFMDWKNSYFTMNEENNFMIWHFLKECFQHGWIYKGHESVPWCPRCETAISQHEMLTEDYKTVTHEAIYFALPIKEHENEHLLVWTTTPWTLPANIAVAVDVKLDYSLVESEGKQYWVGKERVEKLFAKRDHKVIKTVKGEELVGLSYDGPFDQLPAVKEVADKNPGKFHIVIATDDQIMPITTEEGTGLVHTAVSAGTEDFKLGKKLGLPLIPVIADNADYLPGFDFLSGQNAKNKPRVILNYLQQETDAGKPWVFLIEQYTHRYPGCWRCKAELVWKVADEWYIAMDKASASTPDDKRTLRERMMDVTKKITWMPEFGLDRELDWLKNMHDWLISKKNRYWGLALPIYECKECKTFEVIGSKEELQKRAVSGWSEFEGKTPHKPYIDEVTIKCATCDKEIHRIDDVGNPWLDAGIVPFSTIKKNNQGEPLYKVDRAAWQEWFPVDFITESFPGQFKNWFYALIAMSTVLEDTNPFKRVLGFATLLGEDGRPMHKSWGNSIEFNSGADEIGVDVMRWMYVRQSPADNLLFGPNKANDVRRLFYLTLWNSFKFYRDYAAIDGFKPDNAVSENVLDAWMLTRLAEVNQSVKTSLSSFNAREAANAVEAFVQDLSTWYIRRSRDRIGPSATDTADKQAFYNTVHTVLVDFAIIISPMLPFISEEIYTSLTGKESVHLADWPEVAGKIDTKSLTDMALVRELVEVGHRVRKESGMKVRQPLASVTFNLPKARTYMYADREAAYNELIKAELNVKEVKYAAGAEEIQAEFDTNLTPELQLEGEMRDLLRSIQQMRKTKGITLEDSIVLTIPEKFKAHADHIARQVQASEVKYGDEIGIE
ncbi:MAG: class I tRNA ligase family protein [Weeksellaceae bacterium]